MSYDPGDPANPEERVEDVLSAEAIAMLPFLRGRSRHASTVEMRRSIARLLREKGWSYERIGTVLSRHHTSVLALLK
jgi:N-acyl-L-homoserine lactone synthetase